MRIPLLALFALILLPASVAAEHYEVYILAGQSNMDGRASVSDLKGELKHWSEPQPDIRFAYSDSTLRNHHLTSQGWIILAPGYSVPPGMDMKTYRLPGLTFGPELSFGRTTADSRAGRHIAIIKFAEGGTSLRKDWRVGERGALYDQMLAFIAASLDDFKAHGDTYELGGVVWHQGESDSKETRSAYAKLLSDLRLKTTARILTLQARLS